MCSKRRNLLIQSALAAILVVFSGCSAITQETKAAQAALEAARAAGKDKQCPAEFASVEALVNQAQNMCHLCRISEANALANEALAKANALCPRPVAAPAPAPAPAPEVVRVPAPTVSLSSSPSSVEAGACATLTWSTSNATSVSIDPGVGTVDANGSKQVCPTSTTRYTLTANGTGGTRTDTASVEVRAKPTPTEKLTIHVNFDTAKSTIRKTDVSDLQKAEALVKKYPNCKIEIDGYTDSRGSDAYNQGLSERRADAVKKWLVEHGSTSGDKITTKGFGKANPIGDNKTEKGRFENRRAEVLVFCQ
jgi:outer membrane protein OmpA-like peptidoglycan-associated protein